MRVAITTPESISSDLLQPSHPYTISKDVAYYEQHFQNIVIMTLSEDEWTKIMAVSYEKLTEHIATLVARVNDETLLALEPKELLAA